MATRVLTSAPACKALLAVVCICLFSVELAESRGAARRNLNRAIRAGRSGSSSSRNMEKRDDELLKCCLEPNTAVSKTLTEFITEYDKETGPDPANDWELKRVWTEILVTNGINALRKTDDGTFVTVAGLEREDNCVNYCYKVTTYLFPDENECYQYWQSGVFETLQVGLCPIELSNAEVVNTDSATGIVTARGKEKFLNIMATARFKYVDGGCVPISIDYDLYTRAGFRQNSTRSWSESVVFKEEPFKDSYNDLLVLTNDDIEQCPYRSAI